MESKLCEFLSDKLFISVSEDMSPINSHASGSGYTPDELDVLLKSLLLLI